MATILNFSLAGRRALRPRPPTGETGAIVLFPGIRYERLEDRRTGRSAGKAAGSSGGKPGCKTDF